MSDKRLPSRKGRGASHNPPNRFHTTALEPFDDGWGTLETAVPTLKTTLGIDRSRTVIGYNQSPDVPFDRSINPYRGCEHGCCYCFARPSHAYLDLSPGLDFETRLFYKPDAPAQLRQELARPHYRCAPIALGVNTDAYQPVERKTGLTRQLLEVLLACRHPVSLITKSALIERDLDLLVALARVQLVQVQISITTLDHELARRLEPRATAPTRRLGIVRALSEAGIPVGVLVAPVIPFLNDAELERILEQAREAGAIDAGYVLIRLPREVADLFTEWLHNHYPLQAERVLARIRDAHGGLDYNPEFGARMRGRGIYAELIAARFRKARQGLGFPGHTPLDCTRFTPPARDSAQLSLF